MRSIEAEVCSKQEASYRKLWRLIAERVIELNSDDQITDEEAEHVESECSKKQ